MQLLRNAHVILACIHGGLLGHPPSGQQLNQIRLDVSHLTERFNQSFDCYSAVFN